MTSSYCSFEFDPKPHFATKKANSWSHCVLYYRWVTSDTTGSVTRDRDMLDKTECNLLVSALSSGGSRVMWKGAQWSASCGETFDGIRVYAPPPPPPPSGKCLICQKPGEYFLRFLKIIFAKLRHQGFVEVRLQSTLIYKKSAKQFITIMQK